MTNAKYEVWMNNIALSGISGDIYISAISYRPAKIAAKTSVTAGRDGERIQSIRRGETTVTVSFYLKKTDVSIRQQIVAAVTAWGREGILQTSDRPGQRLHVRCSEYPYVSDTCDWKTPVSIVFKTYEKPFWEEIAPSVLTVSGSSGSGNLYIPGNAGDVPVQVSIVPAGSLANITLNVGDTSITLTGLSATSSTMVTISYDDHGFLQILCGTSSVLRLRTGDDDLLAECGVTNAVSFSASASASVTFQARGLWV